jgi:hypothetical protein
MIFANKIINITNQENPSDELTPEEIEANLIAEIIDQPVDMPLPK